VYDDVILGMNQVARKIAEKPESKLKEAHALAKVVLEY
jgi:hypothetical protein